MSQMVQTEVKEAAPERTGVNRIQGEDSYANAAAVSEASWEKSDTVIVANGDVFADSLSIKFLQTRLVKGGLSYVKK